MLDDTIPHGLWLKKRIISSSTLATLKGEGLALSLLGNKNPVQGAFSVVALPARAVGKCAYLRFFFWVPLGGTGADCPLPREPRSGFAESLCALDLSPELQDSWMLGFQAVWTLGFLGSLFGWENFNIQTKPEGLWLLCIDHILLRPELKVGFPTELFVRSSGKPFSLWRQMRPENGWWGTCFVHVPFW